MDHKDKKHAKPAQAEAGSPDVAVAEQPGQAPAETLSPAQIEELKALAAKANEFKDRLLREAADFENYKKRATRERQDAVTYANESLLAKLVPILDTFEMALAAASVDGASAQSIQTGVAMVYNQLKSTLADVGLEEIDARGKTFDPNFHEAVSQQESTEVPEGGVTQQIRKGYKFRNRLVRPAGVVVAKKPAS
jgi:molecular chaperone GrpE